MLLGHEKIDFLNLPTPLEFLPNLSEDLGVNFYIKRDDLTPFGGGGNKLRKLEYFLKDAKDKGATMLLTTGGAQTNHGRLTAAVASKFNMKAAIVAVDPYPGQLSANLLLDSIMDCPVYLVQEDGIHTKAELAKAAFAKVTEEWEAKGEKVYFIPTGGSNEIGALGYYECGIEIANQIDELELEDPRLITTVGSMGTYLGLKSAQVVEHLPYTLTGVSIMPYPNGPKEYALRKYNKLKDFYKFKETLSLDDFDIKDEYDFGAYNNPVKEVRQAIYYMARKEAIFLDPCYTGKTFNGILQMIKNGEIAKGETIIMLHTGGFPGLYTEHHRVEMEKELGDHIHII